MISRDKAPTAQETFMQMAQAAGLRGRLLVTVGILILIRLGIHLPIPGIDRQRFAADLAGGNQQILGFLDIFSGGGLSALGVFALGILPYINASIIIQLLTTAIPALENLQKNEGEAGRRKISQITRYVSLGWAILQSTLLAALWLRPYALNYGPIFVTQTAIALVAGSMFVMWASEVITESGVGNGASLLIFVNIVATLPKSLNDTIAYINNGQEVVRERVGPVIVLILVFLATIIGIVFVQEAIRRIPIISARRQVGRRILAEQRSYLPLRLNQGGVMPIIFATAILSLPALVAQFTKNTDLSNLVNTYLNPSGSGSWFYALVYLVSIVFFSYFYSSLIVNPVDVAQNLKKMGSSIPGIRPGKATSEYIERVLNRLTFLGAIFLGLIAIIPTAVERVLNVPTFRGLGATSLLILVGVAIDTAKQIQTYVISQRYEGMVKQ